MTRVAQRAISSRSMKFVGLFILVVGCDSTSALKPPEPPELARIDQDVSPIPSTKDASERIETPSLVSGRRAEDATPSDVLARTKLIRSELELLRAYMGRGKAQAPRLRVAAALPRATYHEAARLFALTNELSFELTRSAEARPLKPKDEPKPPDVFLLVDHSLERILMMKGAFKITEEAREIAVTGATPSDALHEVAFASAELNNLLNRQTNAGDVYQQVTSAVHHAVAIQATFPGSMFPEEPAFEPNKTPSQVYQLLLECYGLARKLGASQGIQLVEIMDAETGFRDVSAVDVGELAVLLDEELGYMHKKWAGAEAGLEAYDPGLKFPAHVHQRARLLKGLLQDANGRIR